MIHKIQRSQTESLQRLLAVLRRELKPSPTPAVIKLNPWTLEGGTPDMMVMELLSDPNGSCFLAALIAKSSTFFHYLWPESLDSGGWSK